MDEYIFFIVRDLLLFLLKKITHLNGRHFPIGSDLDKSSYL